jgi:hypothetical protein
MWVSVKIAFKVRCDPMQRGGHVWLSHVIRCHFKYLVLCISLLLFLHDLNILCLPAVGIVQVELNEVLPRLGATSQEWL